MKITSIQQQKKNPLRVSIFLDEKFAFGLDSKFLLDFGLYKDKELTEDEIAIIVRKDTGEKIKGRVVDLISRRPRSEKEVRDYIYQKFREGKFEIEDVYWGDVIEEVISDLKKYDLINDEKFAEWYVRNRKDFKPRGKSLLSQELNQKGVSKNIITQVLAYDDDVDLNLARSLTEKKLRTLDRFSEEKRKEKLIAFLQRKGFGWSIIKKIIS